MENTYFVKTLLGTFVIVTLNEFNQFLELLGLIHPDYVFMTTEKTLCGHTYHIKHFYVDDNEVASYIFDPEYIP